MDIRKVPLRVPGLNPVQRGEARVAKAAEAQQRIAQDVSAAKDRKQKKKLAPVDLKQVGTAFSHHVAIVDDADFALALIDRDFFWQRRATLAPHGPDRRLKSRRNAGGIAL